MTVPHLCPASLAGTPTSRDAYLASRCFLRQYTQATAMAVQSSATPTATPIMTPSVLDFAVEAIEEGEGGGGPRWGEGVGKGGSSGAGLEGGEGGGHTGRGLGLIDAGGASTVSCQA